MYKVINKTKLGLYLYLSVYYVMIAIFSYTRHRNYVRYRNDYERDFIILIKA